MAGTIVYSVVFVESSGGSGNCSPADAETEDWDAARQATVLSEISDGLGFWTSRSRRPDPLTFVLDNQAVQPTSCEPISRPFGDQAKWVADVLTAMGFSSTPTNYGSRARSFVDSRRTSLSADWGFLILVVDSLNDADGSFSDGWSAGAHLNGPYMVMTYDNDGWGISRMNLVTAHESGHIFGALDEYAGSGCSTSDSWGYLNAANVSCNSDGYAADISMMGGGSEMMDPAVDVSTSARYALGWRNPVGTVVDVVRTSTVSLTPYAPDPTSEDTPTYLASGGNTPYPPEGPRWLGGQPRGTAPPVTISRVAGAQWNLDGGSFTSDGVAATDGGFDEEAEPYSFTASSALTYGTYTFGTQSINNFGHESSEATDVLTIEAPTPTPKDPGGDTDGDTVPNSEDTDDDNDGCLDVAEEQTAEGSETTGGRRNPHSFWDLMSVFTGNPPVRDTTVSIADIVAIVLRFGANDIGAGQFDRNSDPLSTPKKVTGDGREDYHPSYDRGGSDPARNVWNLLPPDGAISVGDIRAVVNQFGHTCL